MYIVSLLFYSLVILLPRYKTLRKLWHWPVSMPHNISENLLALSDVYILTLSWLNFPFIKMVVLPSIIKAKEERAIFHDFTYSTNLFLEPESCSMSFLQTFLFKLWLLINVSILLSKQQITMGCKQSFLQWFVIFFPSELNQIIYRNQWFIKYKWYVLTLDSEIGTWKYSKTVRIYWILLKLSGWGLSCKEIFEDLVNF